MRKAYYGVERAYFDELYGRELSGCTAESKLRIAQQLFQTSFGCFKRFKQFEKFSRAAETSTVSSLCNGKKSLFLTVAFRTSFCGLYLGNMRCALRLHKLVHNVHFLVICKGLHMNEISSRLSETRV